MAYNVASGGLGGLIYDPRYATMSGNTTKFRSPSSSGAGGTGGGIGASANSAYESARKANEERYNEILTMLKDRYGRLTDEVSKVGAQGEADIRANMAAVGAQQQARLTGRGLANTTVPSSIAVGTGRETEAAVGNYRDALTRYKVGLDQQLSGDVAGFMERRTDAYPDIQSLLPDVRARASAGAASAPTVRRPFVSTFSQPWSIPSQMGYGEQSDLWETGPVQSGTKPPTYLGYIDERVSQFKNRWNM